MQFIHDHIIASLIGGVVLFLLAALQISGQRASTETNLYYVNRSQTMTLVDMIQRDFPNIGAGVAAGEAMITEYEWGGGQRRFTFQATIDSTQGAPAQQVRYEVSATSNPACERAGVPCFVVERFEDTGGGFQAAGRSPDTITEFDITLSPNTGDFRDVREVHVRLAALSPVGEESIIQRTTWETRFRPFSLSLQGQ